VTLIYRNGPLYPQTPIRGEFTTGRFISSSQPRLPTQRPQ